MLDALQFVQGAVSRKGFVPALSHFRIENGTITGYDGRVALCSPIDLDLTVSPKAIPFAKAIGFCAESVALTLTGTGRIAIRSGAFRAYIECTSEEFPPVYPEGERVEIDGERLLAALRVLAPFIAQDASREWARGVLFRERSVFATNNIVLIEHWLSSTLLPVSVNLPEAAVDELLRIKTPPKFARFTKDNVTFEYENGCWLKAQVYTLEWPDVSALLDGNVATGEGLPPVPMGLFEALERLKPFVDECKRVHILPGRIGTSADEDGSAGAHVAIAGLCGAGVYNHTMLAGLDGIATAIDFNSWPRTPFVGNGLRGLIIGMRS